MYFIYQRTNGDWILRLNARGHKKELKFRTYYAALEAARVFKFNLNKFDKNNRFLRQRA
jgi:hypothetical protein